MKKVSIHAASHVSIQLAMCRVSRFRVRVRVRVSRVRVRVR